MAAVMGIASRSSPCCHLRSGRQKAIASAGGPAGSVIDILGGRAVADPACMPACRLATVLYLGPDVEHREVAILTLDRSSRLCSGSPASGSSRLHVDVRLVQRRGARFLRDVTLHLVVARGDGACSSAGRSTPRWNAAAALREAPFLKLGLADAAKPARVSTPLSTRRDSQPWPRPDSPRRPRCDGGKDAPVSEVHSSISSWVALDVGAKALEIGAKPLLHGAEPGLARIGIGSHAAQLEQVVFDLLELECVDVPLGLRPSRAPRRLERGELGGASPASSARASVAVLLPECRASRLSRACSSS